MMNFHSPWTNDPSSFAAQWLGFPVSINLTLRLSLSGLFSCVCYDLATFSTFPVIRLSRLAPSSSSSNLLTALLIIPATLRHQHY